MKKQPTPAAAGKSKTRAPRPLTPKQQEFVDQYLVDLSATQAAIRAGYSAKTAGAIGHRLLKKVEIAAAIAAAKTVRAAKTGIDSEWVLRRLGEQAEADLADLYDDVGNLRHPRDWPDVWRKGLVAGVESFMVPKGQDADGKPVYAEVRKVKLADRLRSLELLGKHVNVSAFREQVGLSAPDGGPVQVQEVPLDNIKKALERVRSRKPG